MPVSFFLFPSLPLSSRIPFITNFPLSLHSSPISENFSDKIFHLLCIAITQICFRYVFLSIRKSFFHGRGEGRKGRGRRRWWGRWGAWRAQTRHSRWGRRRQTPRQTKESRQCLSLSFSLSHSPPSTLSCHISNYFQFHFKQEVSRRPIGYTFLLSSSLCVSFMANAVHVTARTWVAHCWRRRVSTCYGTWASTSTWCASYSPSHFKVSTRREWAREGDEGTNLELFLCVSVFYGFCQIFEYYMYTVFSFFATGALRSLSLSLSLSSL